MPENCRHGHSMHCFTLSNQPNNGQWIFRCDFSNVIHYNDDIFDARTYKIMKEKTTFIGESEPIVRIWQTKTVLELPIPIAI